MCYYYMTSKKCVLAQFWRNRSVDVKKSVWKPWVCCTVWLCVFTADEEYEDGIERTCDTLLMCIVTVLNQGLRNGGGVGDVLRRPSKDVSWRNIVFHGAHDRFFLTFLNSIYNPVFVYRVLPFYVVCYKNIMVATESNPLYNRIP